VCPSPPPAVLFGDQCKVLRDYNKMANGILCDILCVLYQGGTFFVSTTQYNGTYCNVSTFTPLCSFFETRMLSSITCICICISHSSDFSQIDSKCEG
jgi:hypothetical protein